MTERAEHTEKVEETQRVEKAETAEPLAQRASAENRLQIDVSDPISPGEEDVFQLTRVPFTRRMSPEIQTRLIATRKFLLDFQDQTFASRLIHIIDDSITSGSYLSSLGETVRDYR